MALAGWNADDEERIRDGENGEERMMKKTEPAQGRAAGVGESDLKLFSIAISAPKTEV